VTRLSTAWGRFWFAPEPTSTLALVRVGVGLLALGWTLSLLPDLFSFFSDDGILPKQPPEGSGAWGLLEIFPSDLALVVVYVALLAGSVALVLGLWTRVASLLAFLGLLAFERRNFAILNSGDGLVRILALFLVLAPAGASLSLDRLRSARDRFWEFPSRAPWALRLIQIQVSVLYLSTVWQKARGDTWNDGTAVSYAQRVADLERFPLPSALTNSLTISNLATFGTLATELALGVLVWNRRLRPWVLGLGLALHAAIEYSIRVGFFSLAIFASYLAFVPPDTARTFILATRERLPRSRLPALAPLRRKLGARVRGAAGPADAP
jgi:Vitamin K-dependent gamma-carboxylase